MPEVYLHYFGTESSTSLLEAHGIIKTDKVKKDLLTPIHCPNCKESNKPDERFCISCKMVLKYESYSQVVQSQSEREDELKTIKEKFVAIESELEDKERKMEQKLNEVIALIQMNPILSNVKSQALLTKRVE